MTSDERAQKEAQKLYSNVKAGIARKDAEKDNRIVAKGMELGVSPKSARILADLGNSLAQGGRSKNGDIMEKELAKTLDALSIVHTSQMPLPQWKKRPIDEVIETQKAIYFLSLKTSPRERGKNTWPTEQKECQRYAEQMGKECRYIALTFSDVENSLQASLPKEVRYSSLKYTDFVSSLFREILDEGRL